MLSLNINFFSPKEKHNASNQIMNSNSAFKLPNIRLCILNKTTMSKMRYLLLFLDPSPKEEKVTA